MAQTHQTFNDGVIKIYSLTDKAAAGEYPQPRAVLKDTLRFEQRTVGVTRYFQALQANIIVKKVVRTQLRGVVNTQDIAVLHDGSVYDIALVQYPYGVTPDCMDLTLVTPARDYIFDDGDRNEST